MSLIPGPRRLALILVAIAALIGVGVYFASRSSLLLDAPAPPVIAAPLDTLPEMPLSVVEAPVTYDLGSVLDSLEVAVPLTYGDLEQRIASSSNKRVHFAFHLRRSPFRMRVEGQRVRISADIEYSGRVWYNPTLGPEMELSCGTGGDLPRRATLTLQTTGELTPEWGVRTHSRVLSLEAYSDSARDRCRLTFLRIDVTEHVFQLTHRLLDEKLADFDAVVAAWPARRRFERIWRDLQRPMRLADSVYMAIHPVRAELGSIGASGGQAYANLRLLAAPRVTTGPKPVHAYVPLPGLERAADVGRGAHVLLDASFTYPIATVILRRALVGRRLELAGHRVRVRDVRLSGIGGGRVALGVVLSGAVRGRLYFTGTPGFDTTARQITVPDLDYDIGTAQILVRGYEWLNDMKLRDFLRETVRLPDSAVVNRLGLLAEQGVNRDLPARGTRLSGRIGRAGVISVRATDTDIRVRASADADLRLSIDRAPSIPRPPDSPEAAEEE